MKLFLLGVFFLFPLLGSCTSGDSEPGPEEDGVANILVFSRTERFRHGSIADGIALFRQLGEENGWNIIATEDPAVFSTEGLEDVDVIVFLNTTGDVLERPQEQAMEAFIRAGGSFMGIHSATDTEYDWAWYGQLVGAYFNGHPRIQTATLEVTGGPHPSTDDLTSLWERTDEWYNFRDVQAGIQPLIMLDESTYEGGTMGEVHPISWYRRFDGGKTFYTGMGHTPGTYGEEGFIAHIRGALRWCLEDGR